MEIGKMINLRRIELGLTLEEVGSVVGVSKSTVKKWEDGFISNMKRDKIALLAKALKISPVCIITGNLEEINTNNSKNLDLSFDEQQLLSNYKKLNADGKEKLLGYSDDLLSSGKYAEDEYIEKHA